MLKDKAQSIKSSMEMPATVRRLANAILSMEPEYNIKEPKFESNEELNQIRVDITELIVTELYQMDFLETSRLIEFGKVVSGVFARRDQVVFQYDKWYINPFDLLNKKPIEEAVFIKKGNRPYLFLWEETIAEILVESYGIYSEEFVGVDFTGKTWINKLNKRMNIHQLVLKFLQYDIYNEDMWELTEYEDAIWFGNKSELDNQSLLMANFLAKKMMEVISLSKGLRDKIDVNKDIIVASERLGEGDDVYWLEFGEFFLIADYELESCVAIGLLKNLVHGECKKFTLNELINNMN